MTTAASAVAEQVRILSRLPERLHADWVALVTRREPPGSVTGFDRLTHDEGEMRHLWRGHVPVMVASGPDLTRNATGRLVAELLLVPAAALSPSLGWRPVDDSEVIASVPCAGRRHELVYR